MELDDALNSMAAIHQQHALKCYLAIHRLKTRFDWPDNDWDEVSQLVRLNEPAFNVEILQPPPVPFDTVTNRRHWILSHGIYPHAYFTMQQWFDSSASDEIFGFFLAQCLEHKQYLSHNVTILFAFEEVWSQLTTASQKLRFIERFCEFVTASFYGNNHVAYKTDGHFVPTEALNKQTLLMDCLSNPGFWGHNLITLASILKRQSQLPTEAFNTLLANLHEQCFWLFDDQLDRPIIERTTASPTSTDVLELSCRHLLLDSKRNLHQITLAESIVYLFDQSWVKAPEQARLIDVLAHFAKD